jgi:catechol 2,3-dioxygenase-like lactoylglutathione lyase family enzyme
VDFKLELVLIPVTDVDRAKEFYVERCGFNLDVDHQPNEEFRVVQITPPGSACSLTIGIGRTGAAPGSYRGTHLVVTDIEAARAELVGRDVDVSEIRHMGPNGWEPGTDPERRDYQSFADFSDPDGNTWGPAGVKPKRAASLIRRSYGLSTTLPKTSRASISRWASAAPARGSSRSTTGVSSPLPASSINRSNSSLAGGIAPVPMIRSRFPL